MIVAMSKRQQIHHRSRALLAESEQSTDVLSVEDVLALGWQARLTGLAIGGDHWQNHMRRVVAVVIDLLACEQEVGILAESMTGVRVSVVLGEVAAGNLDPNSVSLLENVARGP